MITLFESFLKKSDIYYINKDDYNYADGFNRQFKSGDKVLIINDIGFKGFVFSSGAEDHIIGDECVIIRMMGQNAKIKNLRSNKTDILSLDKLLKEDDFDLYQSINKYNL